MVGDLNTEFKRNNGRVERFEKFLLDNNVENAWSRFDIDYTHEFEKDEITYTSTLDHIVWNAALGRNMAAADVLHLSENTSDHEPIYCDLSMTFQQDVSSSNEAEEKPKMISLRTLNSNDWNRSIRY